MFDFHEKRKLRNYIYSPVVMVVIVVLIVLLSRSVYERYQVEREMAARTVEAALRLSELKERADSLEKRVEHLYDERGIEEELRTRFDVVKEGEQVVVIVEDERESVKPSPKPVMATSTEEAPGRWWHRFGF